MPPADNEVPHGTLDLMLLKTAAMGPQHGYGIARRIEQVAEGSPSTRARPTPPCSASSSGWIEASGDGENNRRPGSIDHRRRPAAARRRDRHRAHRGHRLAAASTSRAGSAVPAPSWPRSLPARRRPRRNPATSTCWPTTSCLRPVARRGRCAVRAFGGVDQCGAATRTSAACRRSKPSLGSPSRRVRAAAPPAFTVGCHTRAGHRAHHAAHALAYGVPCARFLPGGSPGTCGRSIPGARRWAATGG